MGMTKRLLWAAGLSLLGLVVCAPHAHADTFDVSGSATNITAGSLGSCGPGATCAFSGTLIIDVTGATVNMFGGLLSVDITFPGLASFTTVVGSRILNPGQSDWEIDVNNTNADEIFLHFTTTKTPASLVGFTGGSILAGGADECPTPMSCNEVFSITGGSITPAPTATPEPGSLVLMFLGLGALALIVRRPTRHSRPLAV